MISGLQKKLTEGTDTDEGKALMKTIAERREVAVGTRGKVFDLLKQGDTAGANELLARCRPLLVVETRTPAALAAVRAVLDPLGYRPVPVPGVLPYNTVLGVA